MPLGVINDPLLSSRTPSRVLPSQIPFFFLPFANLSIRTAAGTATGDDISSLKRVSYLLILPSLDFIELLFNNVSSRSPIGIAFLERVIVRTSIVACAPGSSWLIQRGSVDEVVRVTFHGALFPRSLRGPTKGSFFQKRLTPLRLPLHQLLRRLFSAFPVSSARRTRTSLINSIQRRRFQLDRVVYPLLGYETIPFSSFFPRSNSTG